MSDTGNGGSGVEGNQEEPEDDDEVEVNAGVDLGLLRDRCFDRVSSSFDGRTISMTSCHRGLEVLADDGGV